MIASREEIAKAEVEAYYKTHYRLDWLLYRTLGYALLSSALAIYVFWAESGYGEHPIGVVLGLSVTWIVLLAMGMLWYDFHTRVSYETWPEVRRRVSRHLVVSLTAFVAAFLFANVIHGACVLVDRSVTKSEPFKDTGYVPVRKHKIHWANGVAPSALTKGKAAKPEKNSGKAVAPAKDASKPASKPADTTKKPAANVTATVKPAPKAVAASAKPSPKTIAPAKKAAPPKKVAPQKKSVVRYERNGARMVKNGLKYHYYGGRWHLLRRQ